MDMKFTVTPLFYVIIGLLSGVAIGWIIGFLDSNDRTSKKIRAAELKAENSIKEADEKAAQALQRAETSRDDPGVLRIKKDVDRFKVEVGGVPLDEMISPDKKKRLIELVTVLRPWLEGGSAQQAVSAPPAPVQTPPVPDPAQAIVYAPAASSTQPLPPLTKKPEAEKNIKALSIVAQIDTVLQARIVDTALDKRGIRLQESLQGGVEVYVGLDKYQTVDDVPDETIKATIRAAIAEWEDKYTPGM